MGRIARLLALTALTLVVLSLPSAARAATTQHVCSDTDRVCVDVTALDAAVSAGGWTRYEVTLSNNGPSAITNAAVDLTAENGTPVAPSSCLLAGAVADCALGQVPAGDSRTITGVVFHAGSTDLDPATGLVQRIDTVASYYNGASDPDPGRQDTIRVTTDTAAPSDGTAVSWIPQDTAARLATVDSLQTITAHIPPQSNAITAQLGKDLATPFTCPKGEVCRGGGWLTAVVPFAYTDAPLGFRLHWDAALVAKRQTVRNFVVWHLSDLGVLEQISRKCSSPTPPPAELPCLTDISVGTGGADATLLTTHNGRMR
jgi:hypothetical protein